jgi:hypothetical protein
MATATATRGTRVKAGTRKAAPAPAPAPQTFPKFEIPVIESVDEGVVALDELIEFVQYRKSIAQDANKAQYWNGQLQALRQLRNLFGQLVAPSEGE